MRPVSENDRGEVHIAEGQMMAAGEVVEFVAEVAVASAERELDEEAKSAENPGNACAGWCGCRCNPLGGFRHLGVKLYHDGMRRRRFQPRSASKPCRRSSC